jgi:hypothetical protein
MTTTDTGWSIRKVSRFAIRASRPVALRRSRRDYPHVIVHNAHARQLHVVLPGESLEWIAVKYFGDARYASLLLRVNHSAVRFMATLTTAAMLIPGQIIVFPTKQELMLHRNRLILRERFVLPPNKQD